ncbi:DUF1178 family protein [Sphingomonas donggukensis]|uniref:DUF1178 family protein n=1 Tax=Sphingomonas donggukensis TaxID=2949093 RepID=A0ABY4TWJ0_9SPHN|nr:DUF1178 family protein [Sphingomonas donggukensis]URW76225.1 DUF1178 family protein [Sphingomonas donggukensis]
MIVFDLKCAHAHIFEAWFASSAAYDDQRAQGLLLCPICGDSDVAKAVMAPNIASKGNQATANPRPDAAMKAAIAALAKAQAAALESSTWVGTAFADTARAMHAGDRDTAPIHGQATRAEARALAEDGVPVAPLLVPIVPPEAVN